MGDNGWTIDGLPINGDWSGACGCPPAGPPNSSVANVILTGVPATIKAPYAWGITLNDGASPPNLTIDHYDSTGALIDSPLEMSGVNGSTTFNDAVRIPAAPLIIPNAGDQLILGGGQPGQVLTALNSTPGQVAWADAPRPEVSEAPLDGQQYGRQSAAWTPVPGFPEAPTDGQIYGRQVANWTSIGGQFLQTIGGTLTGQLYLGGTPASRFIAGGQQGTGVRWAVNYGDATVETGLNAGSNFSIQSFTDTGAPLATPLSINRQLSTITLAGSPGSPFVNLTGPAGSWRSIAGQTGVNNRWQMYLGDFAGELGANAGSNFRISSYTDAGGALASPLIISRQTGQTTFSTMPSIPGGVLNYVLATNGAGALAWVPQGGGIPEAPIDGRLYGRENAAWVVIPTGGGGIPDAPSDGTAYGRLNASWQPVLPLTGGTLTGSLGVAQTILLEGGASSAQYQFSLNGQLRGQLQMAADGTYAMHRFDASGGFLGPIWQTNPAGVTLYTCPTGDPLQAFTPGGMSCRIGLEILGQAKWSFGPRGDFADFDTLPAGEDEDEDDLDLDRLERAAGSFVIEDETHSALRMIIDAATGVTTFSAPVVAPGVSFGSNLAASPTDLSRHISLYGSAWGISVTGNNMNFVASSVAVCAFTGSNILAAVPVNLPADPTLPLQAATKQYVDAHGALPSTTLPLMDGTAAVGTGLTYARADHVHPSDTSLLPLIGGTLTGYLAFNGTPANRAIAGQTGGQMRWALYPGDTTVEGGSNSGSNFAIQSFSDVSAPLGTPLMINRATGRTTLSAIPSIPGGAAGEVLTTDGAGNLTWGGSVLGENRIINGDFRIDQRNNGVSSSNVETYTMDRWYWGATQINKGAWSRGPAGPVLQSFGYGYTWSFESSPTAYPALAGDYFVLEQPIEADMISDFAWGTASAQPVTLSFIIYSIVVTGTFSGSIRSAGSPGRAYPFTFQVPTINTWYRIVVTIPGDTATGVWAMSGNGIGCYVCFDYGSGSSYRSPAGAWVSNPSVGATGAVSIVGVADATVYMTGVKLEIGSVATAFNRQSLAKIMMDCQRYYVRTAAHFVNVLEPSGYGSVSGFLPAMRAAPTITSSIIIPDTNLSYFNIDNIATNSFRCISAPAVAGLHSFDRNIFASAEL